MPFVVGQTLAGQALTLTQMVAAVVDRTDRPDMTTTITGFIQQAASQIHNQNDFAKDITFATCVNPNGAQYTYDLDLSQLTYYRKIKEIVFLDANGNELWDVKINKVSADTLLDYNGCPANNNNTYMQVGGYKIRIRSNFPFLAVNVYYYAWPQMGNTDNTFTSWIATEYPWIFIDLAVRAVKNNTGDDVGDAE